MDQTFIDNFSEAEKLFKNNKLEESLKKYKALLKEQPEHIPVLNNIGLVYEKLHDFGKAVEFYKRCNDLVPGHVILTSNLANAYTRLERWAEAIPLLEKIVDAEFENEKNTEKYALCLFNIKPWEDTKNFLTSAVSKYPDNQLLNRLLGKSLLHLNCHIDGLKHLQRGSGFIEFDNDGIKYLN